MIRFEVYISDEGLAEINGEPLPPMPGQSVHEAVLDRLQRYAVENAGVVEATVNEPSDTGHFVVQVSPDGSSRLLESGPGPEPGRVPRAAPEVTTRSGTAVATDSGTAVAIAVARATAAARATGRASARTPDVVLPAELAAPVGRINALAAAGRLAEAHALATKLRESLTDEAGAEDPHAVEARAVEAHIAHLSGNHREAVVLALAVARIRCRAGDRRAPEEVARATAAWQWLDDDRTAVAHGRELLHMWDRLGRRGLVRSPHAELVGRVRRRVDALEAFV
ncbi:hypothetical protein ABZ619_17130 [Streptomyces sp. NPDC007851]|uniref:hypothetical protein n=1 Tax=Streptomyces sp. NPDC007851 TaxID=3155008 RepID=UPI0033DE1AA2